MKKLWFFFVVIFSFVFVTVLTAQNVSPYFSMVKGMENTRENISSKSLMDGVQVAWVRTYGFGNWTSNEAYSISVDDSGNVYVTGTNTDNSTSSSGDYCTIKYNSEGIRMWVEYYNGPGNSEDRANDVEVDGSGNVYVTGYSQGSSTSSDYATVKYNSAGVEQWVERYNGVGNLDDRSYDLEIDDTGNIYVTGYSQGSGTSYDYVTVKYSSEGERKWVKIYNGSGNSDDFAYDLEVDGSGNVYVTGYSIGSGTSRDYATVKYNSIGIEQWVVRYNGTGNSNDGAYAIRIDGSCNIYVTGYSQGSGTSFDYATVKYNSAGIEQWVARYNGMGNSDDFANDLEVDSTGNTCVTGYSYGSDPYCDYATVKYNSDGVEQWVARYNGPGNSIDVANDAEVDDSGNVYVTGYSKGSGTSSQTQIQPYDCTTVKYNSAGVEQWVSRYNYSGDTYNIASALEIDGTGNIYITGFFYISDMFLSSNYLTIKYTQNPTVVGEISGSLSEEYLLSQNYPNPFNPTTKIKWQSPIGGWQTLIVYDVLGNEVATLVNEYKNAGSYEVNFDASKLSSGIYFYHLQAGSFIETKKMLLLK
jgi:uncharacterized delta-60 repeat protein